MQSSRRNSRSSNDTSVADLEKQEKLGKEKTVVESLKPLLSQIRTLSEKLRQKPACESELADLEAKHAKKIHEQKAISNTVAQLAFDEEEYLAFERETKRVQSVQLRFIELGKKIGQGIMEKQQLAELTGRIATRNSGLASLSEEILAAAFNPEEVTEREKALAATDSALRNEDVLIAGAQRDLHFTREKIADYKKGEEQIASLKKEAESHKDEIDLLKLTRNLIAEYVVYLMQVVRSRI